MSDKHEAKQKNLRAKAHVAPQQPNSQNDKNQSHIEGEIKEAAGNVQEELGKIRASANRAHQG